MASYNPTAELARLKALSEVLKLERTTRAGSRRSPTDCYRACDYRAADALDAIADEILNEDPKAASWAAYAACDSVESMDRLKAECKNLTHWLGLMRQPSPQARLAEWRGTSCVVDAASDGFLESYGFHPDDEHGLIGAVSYGDGIVGSNAGHIAIDRKGFVLELDGGESRGSLADLEQILFCWLIGEYGV